MRGPRAVYLVMRRVRLDTDTADRMLAGEIRPADAPPGFEAVCGLLEAARVATPAADLVAAGRPAEPTRHRRQSMLWSISSRSRISVVAAAAVLSGMTGAAYAAGLPGAASDTARSMLDSLGITVPGPNDHSGTHPSGTNGSSGATTNDAGTGGVAGGKSRAHRQDADAKDHETGNQSSGKGKGAEISTLARTTTATGVDKGAEISTLASGGHSQAGQHGHPSGSSDTGAEHSGGKSSDHPGGGSSQHGTGRPS